MTTFPYPLRVGRAEPSRVPAPNAAVEAASLARVPFHLVRKVSIGDTGTGVGATTIPLFIAPAGSRPWECVVDVITAYNPAASNTNLRIGTATSTGIIFAATTINTVGRRDAVETGAQVSANNIVFSVDTTIQAIVSIDTSAVTAGEFEVTGIFR